MQLVIITPPSSTDTPSTDTKDTPSTDTTETTDAPAVDEAVAAAQAQIDALATAEELAALMTAMDAAEDSGDEAAYTAAAEQFGAASDAYATARAAYDALTPAQQALIDPARLNSLGAYLDEIYGAEALGNTVTEGDAVAKIENGSEPSYYSSLSYALSAYSSLSGGENTGIILLQNVTSDVTFSVSASIILNLNGHSITNLTIDVSGASDTDQLTIENKKTSDNTGNTNDTGTVSTLTVTSGTVAISSNVTVSSLSVSEGGTAKVSGGTVSAISSAAGTIEYSAGTLTLPTSGDVKIGTLNIGNGGDGNILLTLPSNVEIGTLNIDKGTVNITGGTVDAVEIAGGTLNISGGLVKKLEVKTGATVNITGGTVGVNDSSNDNDLTVTDGTVNVSGGTIVKINLGTGTMQSNGSYNCSGNGTVNISPSVQQTNSNNAPITRLDYYAGNLNFNEPTGSSFNKTQKVIQELYVYNPKVELSGGVFGKISSQVSNLKVVDLLDDGYAVCYKDGETEKVANAFSISKTSDITLTNNNYPSAIYIATHDCDEYNKSSEQPYNNTYDNVRRCDCGRPCKHTSVDDTGKCLCSMQFAAKVVKANANSDTTTNYLESEPTGGNYVAKLTTGEGKIPTYYDGADNNQKTALQQAFTDASGKATSTLTLLADVSFDQTTATDNFVVNKGNFSLDLNGKSINNSFLANGGTITITDSATNSTTGELKNLTVGANSEIAENAVVTIKNGTFNSIGVYGGNLTFENGTVAPPTGDSDTSNNSVLIIQGGTATVKGGTINAIDVGYNQHSENPNPSGYPNNGSGALIVTKGEIGTLNYYSGTSVTLKGGQFGSINGNAAGYDPNSTDNQEKERYNTYAKDVVDFLGDNCAYYTSAEDEGNDGLVNTIDNGNQLKKLDAETGKTYYVRAHECEYENAETELYPQCACGRVCHHDGDVSDDGVCEVCGKQLPIKETDEKGNTKRFLLQFPDSDAKGQLKGCYTYTLLADLTGNKVDLNAGRDVADGKTITINLNGHKFVPAEGETGVALGVCCSGATVAITGEGDLSKVTFNLNQTYDNKLDLSRWLGATDQNGLTIAGLKITGKDNEITLKDGLIFNNIGFTPSTQFIPSNPDDGSVSSGSSDPAPAFTAGDLLKNSGFKLVILGESTETNVNYSDGIGSDGENTYKVVKCTHTEIESQKCKHCGQAIVAELTKAGETTATTYYSSISDALDAAANEGNSGCTIKLVADVSGGAIETNATYTLDLNGKTLTVNGAFNANGGNITLTDSAESKGKLNCSSFKLNADPDDVFTIDGANVEFLDPNNKDFDIQYGELVVKSGKIVGTVTVTDGKLTVTNSPKTTIGEGESATTTTLVPEITKLVVSGGDVKLSGGKYGAVSVTESSGKKLGDLLGDTADVKYGFKQVETGTGTSKNNWYDSSCKYSGITLGADDTLTVEKLPIQSVSSSPTPDTAGGKITCEYGKEPTLSIDSVTLADGTIITNTTGTTNNNRKVSYTWEKPKNGKWTSTSKMSRDYNLGIGSDGLGDRPYRCTVTVDNYSKTVEFNVYVTQNNVKDTSTIQPPNPQKNDGKYTYQPALSPNKYVGTGTPQRIMTTNGDELANKGCYYEFRVKDGNKWTEWKSSTDFKLTEVGEYQVYWRLNGNGLYTFNGSDTYEPNTYVEVEIVPLEITGVSVTGATKVYDGNTDLSTKKDGLTITLNYMEKVPDGDPKSASFTLAKDENSGTDGRDVVKLAFVTKDVGNNKNLTATLLKNFTLANSVTTTDAGTGEITARTLTIKAIDRQVAVGQSAPDLSNPKQGDHCTVDGLVKGETLPGALTLKYLDGNTEVKVPDTSKVGKTYTIQPEFVPTSSTSAQSGIALLATTRSDAADDIVAGNYLVRLQPGTLTVVKNFTITATCDAGGTISPYGTIEVNPGKSQTFTVTPNPGYVVASVKVDGVNLGSISTYTFTNVDKNHTIHATFMLPWGNPQTGVDVG